jgi:hypothetical protein
VGAEYEACIGADVLLEGQEYAQHISGFQPGEQLA